MNIEVSGVNVEQLARWRKAKEVPTSRGPRVLRTATPTPEFWTVWNANKSALRAAGISCEEHQGEWEACWWQELPAEELLRRQQSLLGSRALDAEIEVPCNPGMAYRGFQLAGIKYIRDHEGTMLADEMGIGKTIQAIGVINLLPNICRVLVVTKANLKINWYRELCKWLVRPMSVGIADSKSFPTTDIVIMNYDIAHKYERSLSNYWDLVVLDESHRIKSRTARRTKAIVGYKPTREESKAGMLPTSGIPAKRRLALSGTPIENTIQEMFTVLNYLCPDKFPSRSKFESQWLRGEKSAYGWQISGPKNIANLQQHLRETCLLRRLKKDVLKELPPKTRIIVELDKSGLEEQLKLEKIVAARHEDLMVETQASYELAKAADSEAEFKDKISSLRQRTGVAFSEISRVCHEEALAKLPKVIEALEDDMEENGCKIVVGAYHQDVARRLHEHFPNSVLYSGEIRDDRLKQQAVDRFQNDPTTGPFFGTIRAAGEGITLTASSLVVLVEEDWVPGKITQFEDRCHRMGQLNSVLVKHYVVSGSLDVNKALTCIEKQALADGALDNEKPDADEPALVSGHRSLATKAQVEIEASVVTEEQLVVIHHLVKVLFDQVEMHAVDNAVAGVLASQLRVTAKQAILGRKLVLRYRDKLPGDLVAKCGGWQGEEVSRFKR
jgi:SWI/SNF-related matrix-associated actin-dependent regulator 1 of chromatin subfamily A